MHLSEGTLRRWLDEPFAVDAVSRRHLDACDRCTRRATSIREARDEATALLVPAVAAPAADVAAALARVRARLSTGGGDRPRAAAAWMHDPRRRARVARWSSAVAAAAALSVVLVVTGAADGLFTIFQPRSFVPVAVTAGDIRSLAELANYGDVSGIPSLTVTTASAAAAAAATGVTPQVPASLPAGIPAAPRYAVISGGTVSFTFSASRAAAAAGRAGATLPAMPANIDGSTLRLTLPPVLVESYGIDVSALLREGPAAAGAHALVILASRVPSVTSSGATAAQIESYLLAQPAVPADLATEIRAIGDPSSTLPVPVPLALGTAQQVDVQGVHGLLIGDQTGAGSLVLWERDDTVFAVLGSLAADQVLGVADSLH